MWSWFESDGPPAKHLTHKKSLTGLYDSERLIPEEASTFALGIRSPLIAGHLVMSDGLVLLTGHLMEHGCQSLHVLDNESLVLTLNNCLLYTSPSPRDS